MRARAARLWPWLALLVAAAYLVVLAADLRAVVQGIYRQADFASALYIGELYPRAPADAEVVLTNFPWYTTLWIERLTAWLPAHRQIWQLAPWLGSLGGVGLLAWSTWRAAGGWAAAITGVVLVCASPGLLIAQLPAAGHAYTYAHVCLLGAFLVWTVARASRHGPAVRAAVTAAVALVTAAGLASDQLLLAAGLAPFLLAALVVARGLGGTARRRVALGAVAVTAVSVAGAAAIRAVMEGQGVVAREFDVAFATFDRLGPNLRILLHSLAYLFNGDFGGMRLDATGALTLACAAVMVAAGVVVVRMGRAWWRQAPRADVADGDGARAAHVAFWLLAAAIVVAAFVASDQPVDRYSSRYVVTAAYALAALVPVAAAARGPAARGLVVAGACVLLVAGVRSLADREIPKGFDHYPGGSQSGPLLRLARAENVRHGYAGYWVAAPLSWQMKTEVELYPVVPCPARPAGLCPDDVHYISSWYTPRPGTRSMLVVDPLWTDRGPTEAPAALGRPQRTVRVNRLVVHIYGYDIAERLGRPVG